MRAIGDTMVTAPPLIFSQEHFDEAERVIAKALDLTLNDVAGELAA
jgi:adenosylmethionine-8-amino-7-oxononanoate aminotransferase